MLVITRVHMVGSTTYYKDNAQERSKILMLFCFKFMKAYICQ